jgi:hypothetical protein
LDHEFHFGWLNGKEINGGYGLMKDQLSDRFGGYQGVRVRFGPRRKLVLSIEEIAIYDKSGLFDTLDDCIHGWRNTSIY